MEPPSDLSGRASLDEVTDHGRNGVLAADDKLGDALIGLLTSADLRDSMAYRGQIAAQRYSLDSVASDYEHLYAELLERDPAHG